MFAKTIQPMTRKLFGMKCSRAEIHRKTYALPALSSKDQRLTSFSGLVIFQALFTRLQLKRRLSGCYWHLRVAPIFGHGVMVLLLVLLLVVHLLLGYRELRDIRYYQNDPLVHRILGLIRLPDASTLSRALASTDAQSAERLRRLCRQLVLERRHAWGSSALRWTLTVRCSPPAGLPKGRRSVLTARRRPAQLLSAVLHSGADRADSGCLASPGECA